MEYADFLRGDNDAITWDDVVPLTQEGLSSTQPPAPVVQSQDAPTEFATASGRGQSYSMKEDLLLVSSWLNISMDPVVGSNQSLGAFWQRIESYFHDNKDFPSTRNKKSLQGRWTFINGMVQKFYGHYARAMHARRSGTTEGETIVEACKMFQAVEHKEFTLLPCWRELRHHPKWQSEVSRKKQKTFGGGEARSPSSTHNVQSSPVAGAPEEAACEGVARARRPTGRTWSKEVARGSTSSNSASAPMKDIFDRQFCLKEKIEKDRAKRFAEMMNVDRQRLRLEEECMQLEKVKDEMRIMNMDLSQMDDDQKEYYKSLRQSIIAARRPSSGSLF
ncbi:glutathione S-transferase T2-like [Phragmites australis]|uniref:glutathione S-transferase T2-like n=1 Tax=Phragmites australis TaxID=29695 RepID=UPI002D76835A|nr:glutathione S-transferase T2-like [Phragmites australis]